MNASVWMLKRNYWIAGIGAIVATLAFLAFSFLTVSVNLSVFGSYSEPVSAFSLASDEGLLWVSLLLVLGVLGVAILFMVRPMPFGTQVPFQTQAKWTAIGFIAAAVLSAICVIASIALVQQSVQNLLSGYSGASSVGVDLSNYLSISWGFGAYIFVIGLIAIVVAGVMELLSPTKIPDMAAQWNYPQNQYGAPPVNPGAQPFVDPSSQYGAANPYAGQAYPPATGQQPPAMGQQPPAAPYQPPAQYPPYGQQ